MRTRIKARRIWRHAADPRPCPQGSGLVGGIASVATRASRAQPRAGSRSTRIGNDNSSRQHDRHGMDDFAEGWNDGASAERRTSRVISTPTLRRRRSCTIPFSCISLQKENYLPRPTRNARRAAHGRPRTGSLPPSDPSKNFHPPPSPHCKRFAAPSWFHFWNSHDLRREIFLSHEL